MTAIRKQLSILASYMTNLSKFHIVFSSSTLIRLDKDDFEGHLCQTVNNFVKQVEPAVSFEKEASTPTHQAYQKHNLQVATQKRSWS